MDGFFNGRHVSEDRVIAITRKITKAFMVQRCKLTSVQKIRTNKLADAKTAASKYITKLVPINY